MPTRRARAVILNRIRLNDFVSHKKTELDLSYGINVVVGPNGAGKTSILDAISFALFNDYSGRGKKENLINSRAKKCEAEVEFTEGGIKYVVDWTIERKKSARGSLYRLENDTQTMLAQGGGNSVVPEVEKILGIDRSMFVQSVYVRQGEIEDLVTTNPADRKTLISKLLGVEDLQRAWETVKVVIDEFERKSERLEVELAQRATIEADRQRHLTTSQEIEKSLKSKRGELEDLEKVIVDLQLVLDRLKESKKAYDKLDKQRIVTQKEVENDSRKLSEELAELEEAIKAEEKVRGLQDQVAKLQFLENYVSALSERREQEVQQLRLKDRLENLDRLERTLKENEANHELYVDKEALLNMKNSERKKLESARDALERTLKQIEQAEKEEKKKSAELDRELSEWTQTLGEEVNIDNFEAVHEEKRKELRNIAEKLGERVNDSRGRIGRLEGRLKELDDSIMKLGETKTEATKCPTCETELPADRVAQLLTKFRAERVGTDAELQWLLAELNDIITSKREADERFRRADYLDDEKLRNQSVELGEKRAELNRQRSEVKDLQAHAELLRSLDEELKRLESEKSMFQEAFHEFESAKRELAKLPSREQINSEMRPVLAALEAISDRMSSAVVALGAKPSMPEEELRLLRLKKQEYDQNLAAARRRSELEQKVEMTRHYMKEKEGKLEEIDAAVQELAYDEPRHLLKQQEFDAQNRRRSSLNGDISGLDARKKDADAEAENCDRKLEGLKDKEREKRTVDSFTRLLNKIRATYGKDGVQKIIRAKARPLLERSTRDLFERFNLAYSDIKIDDDYNIVAIGPSGEQDIDQISGGERVALAIALRLAIAQVLSGRVETIIMDEPTTHLDEERRRELVNILSSFFREGGRIIPQMLLITHHRELEDVADTVYTIKKEEGYSIAELEIPSNTS
jgi:exonuclease SbcC